MSNVLLKDVFDPHYLQLLHERIAKINDLMEECDVLIFVARKAACFYCALLRNEYLNNANERYCEV